LILQAFLQRVINGDGKIHPEMAAGKGRVDICLIYNDKKYPIELKIRRNEKTLPEGIDKTLRYMDTFGCSEGWLVFFDRRTNIKWKEKIFMKKEKVDGKTITIIGL